MTSANYTGLYVTVTYSPITNVTYNPEAHIHKQQAPTHRTFKLYR